MDYINGIIIACVAFYLWRKYWANDSEKNVRSLGEYFQNQLERFKDSRTSSTKSLAEEYEELIKRLAKSYEKYIHLIEKYRHASFIRKWNLRQDWRLYLQAFKDIRESDMDFGADLNNKLLQRAGERKYRALIRLDEIEKRFKKLL